MSAEWYKQYKGGKPVGYPIARENILQVHPVLDLENIESVMKVGYCEYHILPEPSTAGINSYLQHYVPGPDREVEKGRWERTWVVADIEMNEKERAEVYEMAFRELREQRDYTLSLTDYYALQDTPPMPEEIKVYRQKLRDMFKGLTDPFSVEWPVDPENPERGKESPPK